MYGINERRNTGTVKENNNTGITNSLIGTILAHLEH